jgi:hypothetical protein
VIREGDERPVEGSVVSHEHGLRARLERALHERGEAVQRHPERQPFAAEPLEIEPVDLHGAGVDVGCLGADLHVLVLPDHHVVAALADADHAERDHVVPAGDGPRTLDVDAVPGGARHGTSTGVGARGRRRHPVSPPCGGLA